MLQRIPDAIVSRSLLRRAGKSNELRALGIMLYCLGLSIWKAEVVMKEFGGASHEAVRRWYHRCKDMLDPPRRERRGRGG